MQGLGRQHFLDATTRLYKKSRPSIGPSVGPIVRPSVPRYFQILKIEVLEFGKSCNTKNNDTMSDDEVVASFVPPRYFHGRNVSTMINVPFGINGSNKLFDLIG